ncbi:hypothetical protein SARC_06835 [Sphaeroforma arctica JP610]|uniref:Uncharacterized protein n=1 Tax=Sphaeroforma arctica JP610 TaxID=667725 RepID=A0A0L0FW63_9EUKA|nr:hypothetical protein SARC_06835 [Sphaeroforma arctica JP610]KNC80811.1 hypothetical protein SARC_06835 [Sphaeroforma arctica JP610]|eukprot:XP_014154713.1 hypothetical protein SARC_06835 [Sphaeroforma arctica JP610]
MRPPAEYIRTTRISVRHHFSDTTPRSPRKKKQKLHDVGSSGKKTTTNATTTDTNNFGKRSWTSEDSTEEPTTKRLNDGTIGEQSEFAAILEAMALKHEQQFQILIEQGKLRDQ